ncbi:Hypothetical predicted protein [Olea europaea subsp. europaea]|uniref:Uncharacterized protein n=1 Tax=Olea europaea subsp. europaea TaxID=158383 RepID=A0A8S0VD95_OLEEU|nr:Hypothetical predicted protein [Olea europaea subsp. europaea]
MVASSSGHPKPPPSIGQCTFRVVGPLLRLYWMYFRPIRQLKLQSSDCSGIVQCIGASSMPPVSLVEFTLNSAKDFYDVSLKDGYKLANFHHPFRRDGKLLCSKLRIGFQ